MSKYVMGVGYDREYSEWVTTDVMPVDATNTVKEWLVNDGCDPDFSYVVELDLPEVPNRTHNIKTISVDLSKGATHNA